MTGVVEDEHDVLSGDEKIPNAEDESDDALVDEATASDHHTAFMAYQAAKVATGTANPRKAEEQIRNS